MKITRVISSIIKNGVRVITHSPFQSVTRNNELISPFGVDANPYPGIKAAVQSTTSKGRGGILGFFNKFLIALFGEYRTYSTDPAGNAIVTEIYQKNDGSLSIKAAIDGAPAFTFIIDTNGNLSIVTPKTTHTGDIDIVGDLDIDGNLNVSGDVDIDGTLTVEGLFTLNDNAIINGNLTVNGNAEVTGTLDINGIDFASHTHLYFNGAVFTQTGVPQ